MMGEASRTCESVSNSFQDQEVVEINLQKKRSVHCTENPGIRRTTEQKKEIMINFENAFSYIPTAKGAKCKFQ